MKNITTLLCFLLLFASYWSNANAGKDTTPESSVDLEQEEILPKQDASGSGEQNVLDNIYDDEPQDLVNTVLENTGSKFNPVIFTKARLIIGSPVPPNSQEDFAEISLLVKVERGLNAFPQGIKIKKKIGENEGLLFIFPKEDFQIINIANLLTVRDFVFLNENGIVSEIRRRVKKEKVTLETLRPVKYLLQLNDGDVKKYGIKLGYEARLEQNVAIVE